MGCGSSAVQNAVAIQPDHLDDPTKAQTSSDNNPANNVTSQSTPDQQKSTEKTTSVENDGSISIGGEQSTKEPLEPSQKCEETEEEKGKNEGEDSEEKNEVNHNKAPKTPVPEPESIHAPLKRENWTVADEAALRGTSHVTSVRDLAGLLGNADIDGILLARASYRWIISNIALKQNGSNYAEDVLRDRIGSEEGITSLFSAICSALNIVTETVKGRVKEPDYKPGVISESTSEGPTSDGVPSPEDCIAPNTSGVSWWNVVVREEGVFPVDCCRAVTNAGTYSGNTEQIVDYYWLTSPDALLFSHFPDNSKYQGCTRPYSLDEWDRLPKTTPHFHIYNCKMESFGGVFQAGPDSALTLSFITPRLSCNAEILRLDSGETLPEWYSFVKQDGESTTLLTGYPYSGSYITRLLGRARDSPSHPFILLAEVLVEVSEGRGSEHLFPVMLERNLEVNLQGPLIGQLVRHLPVYFSCSVKGASSVAVLVGEKVTVLKKIRDDRKMIALNFNLDQNSPENKAAEKSGHVQKMSEDLNLSNLDQVAASLAADAIRAACDRTSTSKTATVQPRVRVVPDSVVTGWWAGQAHVDSPDVFLAALFSHMDSEYVRLVRFTSKPI